MVCDLAGPLKAPAVNSTDALKAVWAAIINPRFTGGEICSTTPCYYASDER